MDAQKISNELATLKRAVKSAATAPLKEKLKNKIKNLEQVLKDANIPAKKLAMMLLGAKRKVASYTQAEFNAVIKRLSYKAEYSFLKGLTKVEVKDDLKREAKTPGWRFKGRDNFKIPTKKDLINDMGKPTSKRKTYYESRSNRSDVTRPALLVNGGGVENDFPETLKFEKEIHQVGIRKDFGPGLGQTTNYDKYQWQTEYDRDEVDFINKGSVFEIIPNSIETNYAEYKRKGGGESSIRGFVLQDIKDFKSLNAIKDEKYKTGGGVEHDLEEEDFDLFEDFDNLPQDVQDIFFEYEDVDDTYERNKEMLSRLKPLGYTFDYGLDAVPFGLKKMATGGGIDKKIIVETYKGKLEYNNQDIQEMIDNPNLSSDNLPSWLYKTALAGNPDFPKNKKKVIEVLEKIKNSKNDVYINVSSKEPIYKHIIRYEKGGGVENENKEMVLNNAQQIEHHAEELENAARKAKHIPAWVVAKIYNASSNISDATHYLEGVNTMPKEQYERIHAEIENNKMETGGGLNSFLDMQMAVSKICKSNGCTIKDYYLAEKKYSAGGGIGGTFDSSSTGVGIGGTDSSSQSGKTIGGTAASSMAKGGGVGDSKPEYYRYVTIQKVNGGLKISLNEEGIEEVKDLKEDDKSDLDIWSELFEDVQGNSEYVFHADMGESGFGLTSAEGITDGFYYEGEDRSNLYKTDYPESAKVYWFPNYMITSSLDRMVREGSVVFTEAMAKGGGVSKTDSVFRSGESLMIRNPEKMPEYSTFLKKEYQTSVEEKRKNYQKWIPATFYREHLGHYIFIVPEPNGKHKQVTIPKQRTDLVKTYADGGGVGETCEIFDSNGERAIDNKSIEKLTKCVTALPQTKSSNIDSNGNYTKERQKLHTEIINKFKKDVVCIKKGKPIAVLMGGSPASGKSTFLKKYRPYLLSDSLFKVDADEIRAELPEYKGWNATQTHEETGEIVDVLISDRNVGIPCKFDFVFDGTMSSTKRYKTLINILRKEGYDIYIVFMGNIPKDVIKGRALERYKKSGRFVPMFVIEDFYANGEKNLKELKSMVDGYIVVDGSSYDYKIIEQGGKKLPNKRLYEKLGEKIKLKTGGGVDKKKKTDFTISEYIQLEKQKLREHNSKAHEDDRLDWADWKSELTKEDTKEYGIYYNSRMLDSNGDRGVFEYMPTNKNFIEDDYAKGGPTKAQEKVSKIMHEFKEGTLHSGKSDKIVKNPKQAIAIALSESKRGWKHKK